jgi:hypothetical protein
MSGKSPLTHTINSSICLTFWASQFSRENISAACSSMAIAVF